MFFEQFEALRYQLRHLLASADCEHFVAVRDALRHTLVELHALILFHLREFGAGYFWRGGLCDRLRCALLGVFSVVGGRGRCSWRRRRDPFLVVAAEVRFLVRCSCGGFLSLVFRGWFPASLFQEVNLMGNGQGKRYGFFADAQEN